MREPAFEETLEALRLFEDANVPAEIWLLDDIDEFEDGIVTAFVLAIVDNFVLLNRLLQKSWVNGYRLIHVSRIEEVVPEEHTAFILRALKASGEFPSRAPVKGSTFSELLTDIANQFPIVIVCWKDKENSKQDCAGSILDMADDCITVRMISASGYWIKQPAKIPVDKITELIFGSEYERTLDVMGKSSDAKIKNQRD